jgi:flagellar biosynthesis chaperone FliJ
MARDAMRMLRTVRRQSVEQARHVLAACLAVEVAAADRLRVIEATAQRDREANRALPEAHLFTDMFVRRLEVSAANRVVAEADLAAGQAACADARAALVAARTAEEAVQTLIQERAEAVEADDRRREQHALDDMARTRFDSRLR